MDCSLCHDHDMFYSRLGHKHDDLYYTEGEADTLLGGKADTGHVHDDRYYTEGEADILLGGKADTGHVDSQLLFSAHVSSVVSDVTGDGTIYKVIFGTEITDRDSQLQHRVPEYFPHLKLRIIYLLPTSYAEALPHPTRWDGREYKQQKGLLWLVYVIWRGSSVWVLFVPRGMYW